MQKSLAPRGIRRGFSALRSSFGLDLKLGLRMLLKYPMLTIVGGIAIAVATAVGAGASEFVRDLVVPRLPFEDGDRVVRMYHDDLESGDRAEPTLYDLEVWSESLSSLDEIGAFALMEQGLQGDQGEVGSVSLARISASAFRIVGTPPLLGRFLLDSDRRADAEPVVVLGYNVWQTTLGGDPDIVGSEVQIGGTPTTVVGVMPEGFSFPVTQNAWTPLRYDGAALQPGSAPRATLFGRLAPEATFESAQAELDIAGRRAAADFPEAYEQLQPRIVPFAGGASALQMTMILSAVRLFLLFLLVVVCANVATLVFARTVAREGEISVRMALGASRQRLVLQLFAEALVLVGGATLLGMLIARLALGRISRLFFVIQQEPELPYWWNDSFSLTTLLYVGGLVLVGTLLVGVVPALKATRGDIRPRLGQLSTGEHGSLKFGGIWTGVIMFQVALTVAFLPIAVSEAENSFAAVQSDFPATEYLTAQLGQDPSGSAADGSEGPGLELSYQRFQEVRDQLIAEPEVRNAALAGGLSGMNHVLTGFEFLDGGNEEPIASAARVLLIDQNYLDLMGATVVAGRGLEPANFSPAGRQVVVNEAFVEDLLEGRNPLGGQLRFPERAPGSEASLVRVPAAGSTIEVVGVVRNPGIDGYGPGEHPAIYAPFELAPADPSAVGFAGMPQAPAAQLFVEPNPNAGSLVPLLYETVASVDPMLRLSEVGTAADAWGPVHSGARLSGWLFLAIAGIVMLLSAAGIYALMSFTVSRRTREIAIRTAVGAPRGKIIRSVFGKAGLQLLLGISVGAVVAVPVLANEIGDGGIRTLVIVAVLLFATGLAACLVPMRRVLGIPPAAAMKSN